MFTHLVVVCPCLNTNGSSSSLSFRNTLSSRNLHVSRALLLFLEGSLSSLCIVFRIDLIFQIVCRVSRLFTGALPGWRAALTHAPCLPFCSLDARNASLLCWLHASSFTAVLPACLLFTPGRFSHSVSVCGFGPSVSPFLFLHTHTCTNAHTHTVHPRTAIRMHTHTHARTPHAYRHVYAHTHAQTHMPINTHALHTAHLELGTIIWVESLRSVLISPNCDYTCMNNARSGLINVKHVQGIVNT